MPEALPRRAGWPSSPALRLCAGASACSDPGALLPAELCAPAETDLRHGAGTETEDWEGVAVQAVLLVLAQAIGPWRTLMWPW